MTMRRAWSYAGDHSALGSSLVVLLVVLDLINQPTGGFSFPFAAAWIPPRVHTSRRHLSSASSMDPPAQEKDVEQPVLLPRLPLPPPLCSDTPGTWAFDTMSRRVNNEILARTVADCATDWNANPVFSNVRAKVEALRLELEHAATTPLTSLMEPAPTADTLRRQEYKEWQAILQPYLDAGDTWLTAPWMVTEFYVYRRLMDCLDYWNANDKNPGYLYDPFSVPKRNGLLSSVANAEAALRKLDGVASTVASLSLDSDDSDCPVQFQTGVRLATQLALWGNQMDLSLWPADTNMATTDVFSGVLEAAATQLLHDDSTELAHHCFKLWQRNRLSVTKDSDGKSSTQVDIIVDNAGFELVTDLALAQFLIESKIAGKVTFQLKSHPTFVSDAMEKDLLDTVNYYADQLDKAVYPSCVSAGKAWRSMLQTGQWQCVEQSFWVQGLAMWDMPASVRVDLVSRCDLAFVKGDANYRRLLGDRAWDNTAPFVDVVGCYFPVPVCALRTLKAEIGCGMEASQIQRAASLDPNWMTNGRFGVVHFGQGAGK